MKCIPSNTVTAHRSGVPVFLLIFSIYSRLFIMFTIDCITSFLISSLWEGKKGSKKETPAEQWAGPTNLRLCSVLLELQHGHGQKLSHILKIPQSSEMGQFGNYFMLMLTEIRSSKDCVSQDFAPVGVNLNQKNPTQSLYKPYRAETSVRYIQLLVIYVQ